MPFSLAWGVLALPLIYWVHPALAPLVQAIPGPVSLSAVTAVGADSLISLALLAQTHDRSCLEWRRSWYRGRYYCLLPPADTEKTTSPNGLAVLLSRRQSYTFQIDSLILVHTKNVCLRCAQHHSKNTTLIWCFFAKGLYIEYLHCDWGSEVLPLFLQEVHVHCTLFQSLYHMTCLI